MKKLYNVSIKYIYIFVLYVKIKYVDILFLKAM